MKNSKPSYEVVYTLPIKNKNKKELEDIEPLMTKESL
jgi:hypothetical protein